MMRTLTRALLPVSANSNAPAPNNPSVVGSVGKKIAARAADVATEGMQIELENERAVKQLPIFQYRRAAASVGIRQRSVEREGADNRLAEEWNLLPIGMVVPYLTCGAGESAFNGCGRLA